MKLLTLLIALLSFSSAVYSQTQPNKRIREIDIHYNWVFVGENLSVNYTHYFNRHGLTLGLKTHLNQTIRDNKNYVFKKRGYADSFIESLGLNVGYRYDLLKNSELVTPYVYYQCGLSNLKMRHTSSYMDPNNNMITTTRYTQPYFISDNTIGVGLKIKVYKHLYFNQSAGAGVSTFTARSIYANDRGKYSTTLEAAFLLRFGITYRI